MNHQELLGLGTAEELLAESARGLRWEQVPPRVRSSIGDLLLDWLGSAVAGSRTEPVKGILAAGDDLGLSACGGQATIVPTFSTANPLWACLVNGASSHVIEMDDVHPGSV